MIFASVCSGIEAASVAWEPLGFKCVWLSEIDAFPSKVLKHHYPHVPNLGDMTNLSEKEIYQQSTFDVLVGGTPCQGFSVAGLRAGLSGSNGQLAIEYCRIIADKQPQWFVWENVPGVFSSFSGEAEDDDIEWWQTNDFAEILQAFRDSGYSCAYRVFDAQHFGVPQRRRRVFVVGYRGNDWRPPAAVLFDGQSMPGDYQPSKKEREEITGTLDARTTGGGFPGSDGAMNGHVICQSGDNSHPLTTSHSVTEDGNGRGLPIIAIRTANTSSNGIGVDDKAYTLDTNPCAIAYGGNNTKGPIEVATAVTTRMNRFNFHADTLLTYPANQITSPNNRSNPKPGDPVGTLNAGDAAHILVGSFNPGGSAEAKGIGYSEQSTPTLKGSSGGNSIPAIVNTVVRRLTPLECERLQGFPDNWTAIPGAKDTPRYKAIGNSMAVPVMAWIGKRIKEVHNHLKK